MQRTKIVATIGPASGSPDVLEKLIGSGLNVARLNFSHGSHSEHRERVKWIRQLSHRLNKSVAILQDLEGPKIRIGDIASRTIDLRPGNPFTLTTRNVPGDEKEVSVNYADLPKEVKAGDTVLLADGSIELKVERIDEADIGCRVVVGGQLSSHKGLNLPTAILKVSSLTEKDKKDLELGIELQVDYVALSFVRRAADIRSIKRILKDTSSDIPVIAKIERYEALKNIDEIIDASDGVMIARGDLGVEAPLQAVPLAQKRIIRQANIAGKPVITATQMLKSMVENPRPTRAEVTDVANAVLDGTDAVMLSEETAVGHYPVESVSMIAKIAEQVEQSREFIDLMKNRTLKAERVVADSVSHAACNMADELEAAAIITPTFSGRTARMISRYRPRQPILAICSSESVLRRLSLVWGVTACCEENLGTTDEIFEAGEQLARTNGLAKKGDLVVITAGVPVGVRGTTNLIKVTEIG